VALNAFLLETKKQCVEFVRCSSFDLTKQNDLNSIQFEAVLRRVLAAMSRTEVKLERV
jgi:hypothetical protein